MESLSERELLFCAYYSRTHSVREAAARAGFRRKPELNGIRLLEKESVRVEIERLEQRLHTEQEIRDGYRRLAFGPVTDAVKLYSGRGAITRPVGGNGSFPDHRDQTPAHRRH